jgi:hypothetical protein
LLHPFENLPAESFRLKTSVVRRLMGQITDLLRKSSDFSDLAEFFRSCRSDYIVASGLPTIQPELDQNTYKVTYNRTKWRIETG